MAYKTRWQHEDPRLGYPSVDDTQTAPAGGTFPGCISRAKDCGNNQNGQGEFIYLRGVVGTVVGSWVRYNADDWTTDLLTTGMYGPVAVAMAANVAGQWGWYQIQGKAVALAATGYADNTDVYATATPGTISATVTAGSRVLHTLGASAVGVPDVGLAEFEIHRPIINAGKPS